MKLGKLFGTYGLTLFAVFCVFVLWELIVYFLRIPRYLLPSPHEIMYSLFGGEIGWLRHLMVTTYEVFAGMAVGSIAGIALGILMFYSRIFYRVIYPFVLIMQMLPKVAVAPLFLIWFGYGVLPKIMIAALIIFFPMVIATISGLLSVTPELVQLARSLRATGWKTFKKVRLPCAIPHLFDGFKVSITLAVVGAIIAEFVAADAGIGYQIVYSSWIMDTPRAFAGILLITVTGLVLYGAVLVAERLLIPWYVKPREEERKEIKRLVGAA